MQSVPETGWRAERACLELAPWPRALSRLRTCIMRLSLSVCLCLCLSVCPSVCLRGRSGSSTEPRSGSGYSRALSLALRAGLWLARAADSLHTLKRSESAVKITLQNSMVRNTSGATMNSGLVGHPWNTRASACGPQVSLVGGIRLGKNCGLPHEPIRPAP